MYVARKSDFLIISNLFKITFDLSVNPIVVAFDKNLPTIKSIKNLTGLRVIIPTDIAQNIDQIVFLDFVIPITNKRCIHFFNAREWSIVKPDNVLMTKMQVAGKVNIHAEPLLS